MLYVLAALIIIRFALVPIIEWQQTLLENIEAKEFQLSKTNNVIDSVPKINEALEKLIKNNQLKQIKFFNQPTSNAFKLQLQQQIESLFSQFDIKVTNFSWVADLPGEISEARAKISLEGATTNFAKVSIAIAQFQKLLNIVQWDVRIVGMSDSQLGKVNGSIVLVAFNIESSEEKR